MTDCSWFRATPVALACLALGGPAYAHVGEHATAANRGPAWNSDLWLAMSLLLFCGAYGVGLFRLWAKSGAGTGIRFWQATAFAAGWLVLALALLSPIDRLGAERFWAHMVQHELLMVVAPPLVILGQPLVALVWLLPASWRPAAGTAAQWNPVQRLARGLAQPFAAWALFALVLWLWHVPLFFEAALRSDPLHELQHASFLGVGLLFWWMVLRRRQGEAGRGAALLSLFGTAVHGTVLGALLTFAATPWYESYLEAAPPAGLTALEDQQLGGLIMWVPPGMIYLAAGLGVAARWLSEAAAASRRRPATAALPRDD